jgi:hypothetical protein
MLRFPTRWGRQRPLDDDGGNPGPANLGRNGESLVNHVGRRSLVKLGHP